MLIRKSLQRTQIESVAAEGSAADESSTDSSNQMADPLELDSELVAAVTPGQMLQQARIAKDLSEEDVAKSLRLSLRWIQDIEADAFERAPALIYIRGYLRGYARLVGLPAKDVLDAFATMGWEEAGIRDDQDWLRSMGQTSQRQRLFGFYRHIHLGFAITGAIILLLLIILWWYVDQSRVTAAGKAAPAGSKVRSPVAVQPAASKAEPSNIHASSTAKNKSN